MSNIITFDPTDVVMNPVLDPYGRVVGFDYPILSPTQCTLLADLFPDLIKSVTEGPPSFVGRSAFSCKIQAVPYFKYNNGATELVWNVVNYFLHFCPPADMMFARQEILGFMRDFDASLASGTPV